eukprot:jgi/Tetstr1/453370/TSEL_040359.t1
MRTPAGDTAGRPPNTRESDEEFVYLVGGRQRLCLQQRRSLGVGWQLWPAARVLADLLVASPALVHGKRVLELGAGCGLCGLVAAALGASAVELTDGAEQVVAHLRRNVEANAGPPSDGPPPQTSTAVADRGGMGATTGNKQQVDEAETGSSEPPDRVSLQDCGYKPDAIVPAQSYLPVCDTATLQKRSRVPPPPQAEQAGVGGEANGGARCRVYQLDWTEPPPARDTPPDVVLLSDCTYWQHLFGPLCRTLLLTCGPATTVLLAHAERRPSVEAEVFDRLRADFEVELLREEVVTQAGKGGSSLPVRVFSLEVRRGLDIRRRREEALAETEHERTDPAALLERLDMIERDMDSIVAE